MTRPKRREIFSNYSELLFSKLALARNNSCNYLSKSAFCSVCFPHNPLICPINTNIFLPYDHETRRETWYICLGLDRDIGSLWINGTSPKPSDRTQRGPIPLIRTFWRSSRQTPLSVSGTYAPPRSVPIPIHLREIR